MPNLIETIYLASASEHRRKLLEASGLSFKLKPADIDESAIMAAKPFELAQKRAEAKAMAVASKEKRALVIGCDQVLDFNGQSYGKAKTKEEAFTRLKEFSGKTHHLLSAFCLVLAAEKKSQLLFSEVVKVAMPMLPLSDGQIEAYVASGEWQGCAGCYQFENRGVHLFDAVAAESSAIIGLPLTALFKALRQVGIDSLSKPKGPWTIP